MTDGGPAFPTPAFPTPTVMQLQGGEIVGDPCAAGMSLRDYFAAQALNGLVASDDWQGDSEAVEWCYEIADLMLAEREEKRG